MEDDISIGSLDTLNSLQSLEEQQDIQPDLSKVQELLANINTNVEQVKGISFNPDGSYVVKQSKTLRQLMAMVQQWWHMVCNLKNIDFSDLNNYVEEQPEKDGTFSINAMVYMNAAFDMYGRAYRQGMVCPICGKKARYLPPGGYCSTKCLLQAAKNKSLAFLMAPNEKYKSLQQTVNQLYGILKHTNLIINALVMIPDIIRELGSFPIEYRNFVQCKIAEGFTDLQCLIQEAMVYKTQLLQKMLKPVMTGVIAKPVATGMQTINLIVQSLQIAQEAFQIAYDTIKIIIDRLSIPEIAPGLVIPAQSHAWALTPRSFICPTFPPTGTPDLGKIFVILPGAMKSPLYPSSLQSINTQSIDEIVQKLFPPLTPADYYLEPELFQIRYLFSDQSDLVSSVIQQLEDLLRFGPDYIPAFENLLPVKAYTVNGDNVYLPNVAYIWFVLGLLDSWAPHSMALVGNIFNPTA